VRSLIRIVKGAIEPGAKLKIDGLRELLDTGASPIREALSLLTSDNLVERIDQRGFRSAQVSAEDFGGLRRYSDTAMHSRRLGVARKYRERHAGVGGDSCSCAPANDACHLGRF